MTKRFNICVVGAAGRLGSCVLKALLQPEYAQSIYLIGAIVSTRSVYLNKPVADLSGLDTKINFSDDLKKHVALADVIIDCSLPESSMHSLALAKAMNKKIVLCATGFTTEQQATIQQVAQLIPVIFAPNTSVGMNLTNALVKWLAEKVPVATDIQILETHHVHKKDAPSGAAKQLADTVYKVTDNHPVVTSMRLGEAIGEHTLFFTLQGEQIQLSHKAFDRSIFALGALRAAQWVNQATQAGFYTMDDVLSLNNK